MCDNRRARYYSSTDDDWEIDENGGQNNKDCDCNRNSMT